jgi:uncharacterized repeat protein (TIGR01451 family)
MSSLRRFYAALYTVISSLFEPQAKRLPKRNVRMSGVSFARLSWSALILMTSGLSVQSARAATQDGALRMEVITAYNFIVDSNVESPSTYAPRAAYISARLWNDGPTPITDVQAYIGNRTANTPGVYPSRAHPGITGPLPGGEFAFTHEGGDLGTSDASRSLGTIPPGGYIPVYWLVSYPNLDVNGNTVTGGIKPDDDLFLFYDIWATGDEGVTARAVDVQRRVHMRNCISAMANKIFPNGANKVPQEYQDILQKYAPEWNNIPSDGSPGTSVVTEGIWYDLGNVGKGFDNDGDLVPDQNAWLQPVGDPELFDASAFRLKRTYALIVVKLKDGGEAVYDVADQLYFTNLPDNTGVIGLVRYDYLPLKPNASSTTTPYQMAASGSDNEKFNGDFGTGFALSSPDTDLTLSKVVDAATADPGDPLEYTIDFANPGLVDVGNPVGGVPLVVMDSIPAGTTYVGGTAATGNTLPTGVGSYNIFYSTDNGATWSATEPVPASDVTNIQWWLSDTFLAGTSGEVTFSVTVDNPYLQGGSPVLNVAGLAFGNTLPFIEDDAITRLQGTLTISGTTYQDTGVGAGGIYGDGVLNGTEPVIAAVAVRLYYDANNNDVVDSNDYLIETVDTNGSGLYSFLNLPNGEYVVQVDPLDAQIPSGYKSTSPEELAVTLSGISSTGNNFGFAPTLLVTKTGTLTAYPGDAVQYTIGVANNYSASRQNIYTQYAGGTATGSGNKAWLNPANAQGVTNGTVTEALFNNAAETLTVNTYTAPPFPAGSTITSVELVMVGSGANIGAANTNGSLSVSATGVTLNAASLANIADTGFNVNAPSTYTFVRPLVKTAGSWSLAEVSAFAMTFSTNKPTGNGVADLFLDSVALRITVTQPNTLTTVPLTDTYNADELQFVSASPTPNSTSVVGPVGTLTWNNIGPIAPGASVSVTVNFIAKPLPGVNSIITTDTARVSNALFTGNIPAGDGEASAETEILPTASIGDTIFVDVNRSGSQDLSEAGISGVSVQLYQGLTLIDTQVTDSNGNYLFTDLIPGTYEVRVVTGIGTPLEDWTLSSDPDLDGVPFDPLDPDPLGDSSHTRTLAGGDTYVGADFGYFPPGYSLSGIAWIDFDNDGIVDGNEIGIQYATVRLYSGPTLIGTTTTDADGVYTFVGLSAGTYSTEVDLATIPLNLTQTFEADGSINNQNTATISNADIEDVNFGYRYVGTNTLSGTIGLDGSPIDGLLNGTNPSGVAYDETAFSGVEVYLYSWNDDDNDSVIDSGEYLLLTTTTTDVNGDYSFAGLPASDFYLVSMAAPYNNLLITTTSVTPNHPADEIVVSSNSQGFTTGAYAVVPVAAAITNVDFAFESTVDYDFGDLPASYSTLISNNGPRHIIPTTPNLYLGSDVSTEPNGQPSSAANLDTFDDGLAVTGIWQNATNGGTAEVDVVGTGWLVGYIDFNNDGDFLDNGELIANQAAATGSYNLTFDIPVGSLNDTGSTSLYARFRLLPTEPFIPELAYSGEALNGEVEDYQWDFHSITGVVYADADTNLIFSGGDVFASGVVVELRLNSVLIDTRVTGPDGSYSFYGLPAGNYEVNMVTPSGYVAILDVDGIGNGFDQIDVSVTNATITDRDFLIGETRSSIALVKTGTLDLGVVALGGVANAGDEINYTFTVTNTGNVPLTGVTVTDPLVTVVGGPINLAPGQSDSSTFTASYTLTQSDINAGTFTNTATTTGTPPSGPDVEDEDDDTQTLPPAPSIALVKTGTQVLDVVAPSGVANVGDQITYTFAVTNTGNVTLTGVTVTDPLVTVVGSPITLAPGATDSTTFTASYTLTQSDINNGSFLNTATTTGTPPTGPDVEDEDDDTQTLPPAPSIALVKTGTQVLDVVAPSGVANVGDQITYTFAVTNTGNVTLTDVIVTDPLVTVVGSPITLAPGATDSTTFTASYTLTQSDINAGTFTNTATTTGTPPTGPDVEDEDDDTQTLPPAPSIALVKTGTQVLDVVAPSGVANVGDQITYTFAVTNTGNVTLTDVIVTDPLVTVVGSPITLAPGATDSTTFTASYTLTQSDINAGTFTNTATTTGTPPTGPDVEDEDDDTQPLAAAPSISLVKTATPQTYSAVGNQITYSFAVTNTGNVTLSNVTIDDPLVTVVGSLSTLAPGVTDTTTFSAVYTITQTDLNEGTVVNTATVNATDPNNDPVSDDDTETVTAEYGKISGFVLEGTNGIENVLITLLDENGLDIDSDDQTLGIQPTTATTDATGYYEFDDLQPGTYQIKETQPFGYESVGDADGGDPDWIGNETPFVLLPAEHSQNNNFLETVDTCPDDWNEWKAQHPGELPAGNPDQDNYDNFAEFAFAMPYNSGVPSQWLDGTAWIIQPSTLNPDTLEGVFIRPTGAPDNATYILQYSAALGNPTVWQELLIPSPGVSISTVNNGDCTETVTIHNLETITGLIDGKGFVRLKVILDDDGGGDDQDHISYAEVEGWTETEFGLCCQSYNVPYLREAMFTGTVASVSGQGITFTGENFASFLTPGVAYYVEVTTGENEGHRFDVVSASGNTITLALDSDLHGAAPPFNTLTGALPLDLQGDQVILRRHWTLNEIFPPNAFGATGADYTADQVQIFSGNSWQIYWLYDENDANPATASWVDLGDSNNDDKGGVIIPPGQGMFFNNRTLETSLLAYGEVRTNDFIRPLRNGFNLVGGGYPIDQSANGVGGRNMNKPVGFFGSTDFKQADSIFVWKPDANVTAQGYDTYFLLDGAPKNPALLRWVKQAVSPSVIFDSTTLLLHNRAVQVRSKNGLVEHTNPKPWAP